MVLRDKTWKKEKYKMTLNSCLSYCICGDPLPVSDSEVRTLFHLCFCCHDLGGGLGPASLAVLKLSVWQLGAHFLLNGFSQLWAESCREAQVFLNDSCDAIECRIYKSVLFRGNFLS